MATAFACMLIDWWAVRSERARVEQYAKPAVMLALIGFAITADVDPGSLRPWLIAGLQLGLIGDIALLPRFDAFIVGLASFLVGHLAYVVAFTSIWAPGLWLIAGLVGLAALITFYGLPIGRALRGSSLRVPVAAYIGVTGAVIISGSGTGRWLIAIGTLIFAASDGLLGANRFVEPAPQRRWVVHALYHSGQAAIVAGAVVT
jgi:alkenylglycerophosphocholine/alkenylglycerophosphoethanolamine hydrolase